MKQLPKSIEYSPSIIIDNFISISNFPSFYIRIEDMKLLTFSFLMLLEDCNSPIPKCIISQNEEKYYFQVV